MRHRLLIAALAVTAAVIAVVVLFLVGGDSSPKGRPATTAVGQTAGIESQLKADGAAPAPVKDGTTDGSFTNTGPVGRRVALAAVCVGPGAVEVTMNGKTLTQITCASTPTDYIIGGFHFKCPYQRLIIGFHPTPGQHWWAAVSDDPLAAPA